MDEVVFVWYIFVRFRAGGFMVLEQAASDREIVRLVNEYLAKAPQSREIRIRMLGDELLVSHDTIRRWALGKHLPYPAAGEAAIRHIQCLIDGAGTAEEFSQLVRQILDMGDPGGRKDRLQLIAREAGASFPTIERWAKNTNTPHPAIRKALSVALGELKAKLAKP
jgi:hypothetical protein